MLKNIGILYESEFSENSFNEGCSGSDTWVIQIAKEFTKQGYHVYVFSYNNDWIITGAEVEYRDIGMLEYTCSHIHFDYFIFTRLLDHTYKIVNESGCADHIYLQSHDMFIWADGMYKKRFIWEEDRPRFSKVDKFIALTEFHKEELHKYNRIPYDMIEVIGNGVNSDIYDKVSKYKGDVNKIEPSILWTSAFGRGGDILVNDILPLVKESIPNFKVYICGYVDIVPEEIKNNPDVQFVGKLTKEEYYELFFKQFCWFLPCVVVEDFGICALEAAMCNCDIISTYEHGMRDTLWPFISLKMKNNFGDPITNTYHYGKYDINKDSELYKKSCIEAADKIIKSYHNYNSEESKKIRKIQKDFVLGEYTWKNIVKKWIILFNQNE